MSVHIDATQRRARLAVRHHLHPDVRTDDVATITDDLVAVHSSDPATVFLSLAARMATASVPAIEDALYRQRSVLRHHAMRRTLWVMTPSMAQRAHASSTRPLVATERVRVMPWIEAAGIDDPERWFDITTERLVDAVRTTHPITTRDVGKALPDVAAVSLLAGEGTRNATTVSAHSRLLMLAAFAGKLVRTEPVGTWISSQYRWAPIEDWHGVDLDALDVNAASAAMVERYLERFGPVTETDVVWWTGWTKGQTRQALAECGAVEVDLDQGTGWLAKGDTGSTESTGPWVALLPGLDSTTMGWKERSWYLDDDLVPALFDRNGNGGPTVWLDGRIVGGWAQREDGSIALDLPDGFPAWRRSELDVEIERLTRFVGDLRFRPRFPSPNQKDLRG